ncbi:hypothetical protein OG896_24490 [Streptomyces sp. NBC_00669]|uniref:hypothetical protein n=1 Tax=Streptomyces sp. NBC_00669 TaxID=2976011 RepID=UPI002E33D071|nr:hypothetical protein [Streptomyces sp. NBC_00669]
MTSPSVCDPWPLDLGCCDLPEDLDPAVLKRWQRIASETLWRLSGRRWGPSCPVTVRPCGRSCIGSLLPLGSAGGMQSGGWVPYIGADGQWRNASVGCGCRTSCSCSELCEARLDGPVYDIVEVLVDGEALVPEAYRVDVPNLLVRTDGECWPACQDMAAPCGAEGTVCVTYRTGLRLDASATAAVSELTCELVKACLPAGSCGPCRLPGNVTRLARQGVSTTTRQGVTVDSFDPTMVFAAGRTGLPTVDLWLTTVNPDGLPSASRVVSPDYRRPRMMQWP